MANNENLKPLNELSKEDAKKIRSKGGKARAKKIKETKKIKEYLEIGLELPISDKQGNTYSRKEAGVLKLIERYEKGDPKAFDTVVELLGEKPATKQEVSGGLEVQKVFVTPEMHKATLEHIKQVINDQ